MEIIFLIGRILFGGYFAIAGINHFKKSATMVGYAQSRGIRNAKASVVISGFFLLLGGLGIVFGIYIRLAVLLLVIFLLLASFKIHNFWSDKDSQVRTKEMQGFIKNMALVGALLIIYTISSWPLSVAPWV